MTWLIEAITDGRTRRASSARIVSLLAGATLSFCTLWLTIASFWRIELATPLTVFGGALAGLAGANYVAQRVTSGRTDEPRG